MSLTASTGNLHVYLGGVTPQNASNIHCIGTRFVVANFVIAPLSSTGTIALYRAGSPVNARVDVLGCVPSTA